MIERRINILLSMKREVICQGAVLSIQACLSETKDAYRHVMELLNEHEGVVYYEKEDDHSDDGFQQFFAEELFERLIACLCEVDDSNYAGEVIHDLKYLAAVCLQTKDMNGHYRCSNVSYVDFIKSLGYNYIDRECEHCRIETIFTDFKYCVVCGRRIR